MGEQRYFECRNCGQIVQGWHAAMEWIDCCDDKEMVEIFPIVGVDEIHEQALRERAEAHGEDAND